MASWDAKKGEKSPHFYCRKIFLKVVFYEHNMSIIWNSPAPWLEIIYCRKAQWWMRRYYSPYNFCLEFICLKEWVSCEHSFELWRGYEWWCSPGGHAHKALFIFPKRKAHRGPLQSLVSGPAGPKFCLHHWNKSLSLGGGVLSHTPFDLLPLMDIAHPQLSQVLAPTPELLKRCWRTPIMLMEPVTTQLYGDSCRSTLRLGSPGSLSLSHALAKHPPWLPLAELFPTGEEP